MLVFLRLLVQLEKFQQYMVLPCLLHQYMWCNFASCTISIVANIHIVKMKKIVTTLNRMVQQC